jgi:hypothetical protein
MGDFSINIIMKKFTDLKITKPEMYNTILISAFPGTGKSFLFNNTKLKILDSDSSKFDKSKFPENYIDISNLI